MRLLKILVSLVATSRQSEAFNEGRWGEGRGQGSMQRQGVVSSPKGGPFLEACTPYDAEPSICEYHFSSNMTHTGGHFAQMIRGLTAF